MNECIYPNVDGGISRGGHSFDKDGYCNICRTFDKNKRQPLPELEGMDDIFSKICELIVTGKKGDAKKLFAEALDKANTEKESQIVSLQSRIDFQVEANDILYADHKKELKSVIAGKAVLQSKYDEIVEALKMGIKSELLSEEDVRRLSNSKRGLIPYTNFYLRKEYIQAIIEQSKGKE